MPESISPWLISLVVIAIVGGAVLWALVLQNALPQPWGTKEDPIDPRRCPQCGDYAFDATACIQADCPEYRECAHRGCGLVGFQRTRCGFLVCNERDHAQLVHRTFFRPVRDPTVTSIDECRPPRRMEQE